MVQISRPTGTGLTILTDGSQARQLDLTNFELFIRAQGTRTTDNNLELRFYVWNIGNNEWDQIAGAAPNNITVPLDSTVIYTCVKSLLMTPIRQPADGSGKHASCAVRYVAEPRR